MVSAGWVSIFTMIHRLYDSGELHDFFFVSDLFRDTCVRWKLDLVTPMESSVVSLPVSLYGPTFSTPGSWY